MKLYLNIIYLFTLIFFTSYMLHGQTQLLVKPYPGAVELSWLGDPTGSTAEYLIFYIQGEDSTLFETNFNFVTGASYSDVWDWCIGSSLYNYFFIKVKHGVISEPNFLRIGVIALGWDGSFSNLVCIPKCLVVKAPPDPGEVKLNKVK